MAKIEFSSLPAEIQIQIAKYCESNVLNNLCLTSKRMNERCWRILYRHVDLQPDRFDLSDIVNHDYDRMSDAHRRQQRFVHTLLGHPEYSELVRSFRGTLCIPCLGDLDSLGEDMTSDEELWRAMQLLTHVEDVDVGPEHTFAYRMTPPIAQAPKGLFRSATSVRLGGFMQYGLAKSILTAINPATLEYLCLDRVQDCKSGQVQREGVPSYRGEYAPGDRGEDGRIIALGATSGLLMTLTGRCTALRTLILRRVGKGDYTRDWPAAAEEASYNEWAAFIRSVQATVEKFTFEQTGGISLGDMRFIEEARYASRSLDERFERIILPTIVSGNWPCLTDIELRGVWRRNGEGGKVELTSELKAVLGGDTKIVLEDSRHYGKNRWEYIAEIRRGLI